MSEPIGGGESRAARPGLWPRVECSIDSQPELEAAIGRMLSGMTLEEKVGQVIQPQIRSVRPEDIRDYHLGSVLNGGGGWPGNDKHARPEDWLALADAFWEASMECSDGGQAIPVIWGLDAVHGHNNLVGATLFPHNIGLGAAGHPELIRRIGRITARELAVTGQDWTFGPTVAVARDDRWGRTYESYSEDPEIVAAYAAAMVEGLQGEVGGGDFLGEERVIATAKHFLGDGGTERGIDQGDNLAEEEELRDLHGAGYLSALEAGVQTVMVSLSSWQGEKMHGRKDLLTGVLKERMGFDGVVVGDWNGHGQVAGCSNGSCATAFNAGLDIFMVPDDWKDLWTNTLAQVRSGEIPAERLDDAVRRILRVKMRAGLFDRGKPSSRPLAGRTALLGAPEHREVARQAVRESLVLLKNRGGALPLDPRGRILIAGDAADDLGKQAGGWTLTWQGTGNTDRDFPGATSIWGGIREAVEASGGEAVLSPDGRFDTPPDAAVVVFGEDPYAEFQGDLDHLAYSPRSDRDLHLLRRFGVAGVPVVAVFLTGRPLWVNPHLNAADAFVVAWLPGSEGAGVADVLVGGPDGEPRFDFRGRLSFSWPRKPSQAVLNRGEGDDDALFAYGSGLRYGEQGDLGELSEDPGELVTVSRAAYFDDRPLPPWRLFVGVDADPEVPVEGGVTTTRGSRHLEVRPVDRRRQEDARAVRWSGETRAQLFLAADQPVDLGRETNGAMALAFDVLVGEEPSDRVELTMRSADGSSGSVDVSELLAGRSEGDWETVAVPLRCFEEAGANMRRVTVPFSIATRGRLDLTLTDVRLVGADQSPEECP